MVPKVVPKQLCSIFYKKKDYELFHKFIHQICGEKKKGAKVPRFQGTIF